MRTCHLAHDDDVHCRLERIRRCLSCHLHCRRFSCFVIVLGATTCACRKGARYGIARKVVHVVLHCHVLSSEPTVLFLLGCEANTTLGDEPTANQYQNLSDIYRPSLTKRDFLAWS